LLGAPPASAAPRPWCLKSEGTYDCAYSTWQQCYETSKGLGGDCLENPKILWERLRARKVPPTQRKGRGWRD
jgi:hypothetical protein